MSQRLLAWFDIHGRKNLPWQHPIEPYRVWASEIMLQQTQVDTVIPYFLRFMESFPSVEALAAAATDDVLHHWTGLGYYARARNLHACAQAIVDKYQGSFPSDPEELERLPGIGPSTAAAIASIAFNKPCAILDGNVKRVLARHSATEGWPGKTSVAETLWQLAKNHMPQTRCRDYTQAIMDLGATLCKRSKPACSECPISADCLAYQNDTVLQYPGKKPKKTKPIKSQYFLMLKSPEGEVLLYQRPPTGIWGGLWCFPELEAPPVEQKANNRRAENALIKHLNSNYGTFESLEVWRSWRHTFSHYHLDITPVYVHLSKITANTVAEATSIWYNPEQPPAIGLAAPVKQLLETLSSETTGAL